MPPNLIHAPAIIFIVSCLFILALSSLRFVRPSNLRHAILSVAILSALLVPVMRWGVPLRFDMSDLVTSTPPVLQSMASATLADADATNPNILLLVWLCGMVFVLLPVMAGLLGLIRLQGMSAPCTLGHVDVPALTRRLNIRRTVDIRLGKGNPATSAMTWGVLRPVVLLPAEAPTWPAERVEAVLLHELAHIRRLDYLWRWVARLACAVFWFNPLVWWVARRHGVEAELAADRLALSTGIRPSIYANALLAAATRRRPESNALALSHDGKAGIENRILAVLNDDKADQLNPRAVMASAATVAAALLLVSCLQPYAPKPVTPEAEPVITPISSPQTERTSRPAPTPSPERVHNHVTESRLNPDSRDYIYKKERDPRFNPDAREYIYRTEIDPRLNPDSPSYIYRKEIDPRDNPDSREYVPHT